MGIQNADRWSQKAIPFLIDIGGPSLRTRLVGPLVGGGTHLNAGRAYAFKLASVQC